MDPNYSKIIITALIAISGWIVAHYFNEKRNQKSKRRDLSVQHLIEAYRILTNEIAHRERTPERTIQLENLISEIQLFGTSEQVKLTKELADEVASKKQFELDPLINSLRKSLRKELKLSEIEGNVKWLRFTD